MGSYIQNFQKGIHLLYVPTMFCNMSCRYCYLGNLTEVEIDSSQIITTLSRGLKTLLANGYLPFNVSLHGGEVTTLSPQLLDEILNIITAYYSEYAEDIHTLGFNVNPVHIKTNLLNFHQHYNVLVKHKVSISASVDLPFRLQQKFRRDKHDQSTLERILANLKILAHYPHHKKISCVITRAHFDYIDEFIADLKYLHDELGVDMSRFNVMFGFDSRQNRVKFSAPIPGTEMLSDEEQITFYHRLKTAFVNTQLETAFRTEWFREFTPDYCCSAVNCGAKFFLLQADGKVYSCPRGQSSEAFYYGNLLQDDINKIISNGWQTIERNENLLEVDQECLTCVYICYCNAGCCFVRYQTGFTKSYTCRLQQELYHDNPERYPPLGKWQLNHYVKNFLMHNQLKQLPKTHATKSNFVTSELLDARNQLYALIAGDNILRELYSEELFYLRVNGIRYRLKSGILKSEHQIELFNSQSEILLGVRKDAFNLNCTEPVNNYIHLMVLRDTTVVYGDEQRAKQEHLFDHSL